MSCATAPRPDTSKSQGACTTPVNRYNGQCIAKSACTGATFNGLCPGSSVCCAPETSAPTSCAAAPLVSLAAFKSMFNSISATRADALYPYFLSAMAYAEINTCRRAAAFMAQIAHESGGLQYFEELASGAAYEGRSNLGNTQPGDGKRYKGRGPIQLTGRANYTAAARDLGLDVVNNPESVCFPSVGFKTTAWFWKRNKLNVHCDSEDFRELTRRINGGYNGLDDRQRRWAQAKAVLGCRADGSPRLSGLGGGSSSSSSSSSGPSCSVPGRGAGSCVATSACRGTSYPGYCPGAANIQCCVQESAAAAAPVSPTTPWYQFW